jgi:electron transfer flavoprotein alpha subunit
MDQPARRLIALVPFDSAQRADAASVLAAARELSAQFDGSCEAVFVGSSVSDDCVQLAQVSGVAAVWLAAHADLGDGASTDRWVVACHAALAQIGLARGTDTLVLCAAGTFGEELAARLAVHSGGVPLGRCSGITASAGSLSARRAAFGGRAQLQLASDAGPWFAAVRGSKRPSHAAAAQLPAPRVERVQLTAPLPPEAPTREVAADQSRPSLAGARLVVAGGRGMGGEAGFAMLQELSRALGAPLAGSLPTIDSGWLPVAAQVGQSGKFVAPDTYLAVGISGTPQHMAGVSPDTRVIAINKDPQADIFRMAEIGVVAEWEEFLPALLAELARLE